MTASLRHWALSALASGHMNKVAVATGREGTKGPNSTASLHQALPSFHCYQTFHLLAQKTSDSPMAPSPEKAKYLLTDKLITLNPFYLKVIVIDLDWN